MYIETIHTALFTAHVDVDRDGQIVDVTRHDGVVIPSDEVEMIADDLTYEIGGEIAQLVREAASDPYRYYNARGLNK